jgi:hypothetical protein
MFVTVKPEGGFSATVTVPLVGPPLAEFETVTVYVAPVCPCVKFPVCVLVMLNTGAVEPLPPCKGMECGVPVAVSVTCKVAVLKPVCIGLKKTPITQTAWAFNNVVEVQGVFPEPVKLS